MKIYSFIKIGIELKPVEVEMTFLPGLPVFQIMGLPDTSLKESQLRIKSALKSQGFEIPKKKQILVNLRPSNIRKSSRGLDLAIACAYLWKTGQAPYLKELGDQAFIYGELSLDGSVNLPDDFEALIDFPKTSCVLSGATNNNHIHNLYTVTQLSELAHPNFRPQSEYFFPLEKPELPKLAFPTPSARLLKIIAIGRHTTLIAGPAGSGKTTLSEALFHLLDEPNSRTARQIQQISKILGFKNTWLPLVQPHHSTPPLSMIGGGAPPFPGEITRAHGGLLVLDELLEFDTKAREALREPIEKGCITISRRGKNQKFPADFQLISTTNLCPCGDFTPQSTTSCRFSLRKCQSYVERLSGPLVDRFEIMSFSHLWKSDKEETLAEISNEVQQARNFQKNKRKQQITNNKLSIEQLEQMIDPVVYEHIMPQDFSSRRRKLALLRVARSIADIDCSKNIEIKHINEANEYTIKSFYDLQRAFS